MKKVFAKVVLPARGGKSKEVSSGKSDSQGVMEFNYPYQVDMPQKDYQPIQVSLVQDLLLDKSIRKYSLPWKECFLPINIGKYQVNRVVDMTPGGQAYV